MIRKESICSDASGYELARYNNNTSSSKKSKRLKVKNNSLGGTAGQKNSGISCTVCLLTSIIVLLTLMLIVSIASSWYLWQELEEFKEEFYNKTTNWNSADVGIFQGKCFELHAI